MGVIEISTMIAVIGCAVGVAGWVGGQNRHAGDDGHWRGTVDTKLDDIRASVSGTTAELVKINETIKLHGERITAVESSAKQAHRRIDRLDKIVNPTDEESR